jgi:rRNA maturation RNase YbeY
MEPVRKDPVNNDKKIEADNVAPGWVMNDICFFSEEISFTLPDPAATATWIQSVIQQEGYVLVQLNFVFCADLYLHAKNVQYLQHDTLTDVLTFDHTDKSGTIEGDIYISIDRVSANAQTWHQSFMQELQTVMVHGVLHLLGYEDQTPAAKALMRQKETEYITQNKNAFAVVNTPSIQKALTKKTKKISISENWCATLS